jgi:hypothetical protein
VNRGSPSEPYGLYLNQSGLWQTLLADFKGCPAGGGAPSTYVCAPSGLPPVAYEDDYIARGAVGLLARKPAGVPWFMQVGFAGPHPPFVVTPEMLKPVEGAAYPEPVGNSAITRAAAEASRRAYAAELEHLDALFAEVLAAVEARGEMNNTIVFVLSDHGEMLGDHDDWGKEQPWFGSVSVPFLVSAPSLGIPQGVAIADVPIATMDLSGTILDWAGATLGVNMTTVSLRPFLKSSQDGSARASYRPFVSSGLSSWRAVVQSAGDGSIYKLICCKGVCPGQPANVSRPGADTARPPHSVWVGGNPSEYPLLGDSGAELIFSGPYEGSPGAAGHTLLYDVVSDPYDTQPLSKPAVVAGLVQLLPAGWCH